jgi:aspartokinase/homoserine dehydrogenase 1
MIVLKFGGSSIGNAESIKKGIEIIKNYSSEKDLVVVVSALQGVTNLLESSGVKSLNKNTDYLGQIEEIENMHLAIVNELIAADGRDALVGFVKELCGEAKEICQGVEILGEYTDKAKARLLGIGERLSSRVISEIYAEEGIVNVLKDACEFIVTDDNFLSAKVDATVSSKKTNEVFADVNCLAVVPGYIAATVSGQITTLGRGGSDYTASLIAKYLDAERIDIWTDVDGMLTASPEMVSASYSIPKLSYEEAMELSYFGAKVLYPISVQPAMEKQIPIVVKNTFNTDFEGTLISKYEDENGSVVKGFSSIDNISLVTLSGAGMVGVPGVAARAFKALSDANINILTITQSSSEHTISVGICSDVASQAAERIDAEFEVEIGRGKIRKTELENKLSIVAIVGDKMRESVGVAGKALRLLGLNGINIHSIAQGGTERNITVIVNDKNTKKALNVLHDGFFLSKYKKVHLYAIGIGTVGGTMLKQLKEQYEYLKEEYRIDVRLVGVANSRKMLFDEKGIDLENYKSLLDSDGETMTLQGYVERIKAQNLRHGIFVDNTASSDIAGIYNDVALQNVSIVTSNKVMASSPLPKLEELKGILKERGLKFLNETNVAAGLPILKTIEDLVAAGDKIVKIQAVLSGSLNFIFNNISETLSFSEAVVQAREKGLTEPDPSIDLSGLDVMRKILILARVSGYRLELEDVKSQDIIPKKDQEADSFEELLKNLERNNDQIEEIRKKADAENRELRYVAEFENGEAVTGLQAVDSSHPAYYLDGMDNIILLYTQRYADQPLVIKGAGAGPEVTATGVFADVMRLANI